MSLEHLKIAGRDEDGFVLTDGASDGCYIYFSEIPGLMSVFRDEYYRWRNLE
jgi:hypothetical protein